MLVSGVEPIRRLDISPHYFLYGLRCCATASERDRAQVEADLEAEWAADDSDLSPASFPLSALSVRTGFDAFLTASRLDFGSEVLMSAITIPDMVKIVEGHGLRLVGIDLEFESLAPRLDLMKAALNEQTKAIVVSHVFGTITNMDEIVEWAHDNGLLVVEDCAEAYCGPSYRGHKDVDISLFSFGTIKTETALGGALMRVKDLEIWKDMKEHVAHFPVQALSVFSSRLAKYSVFSSLVLNRPKSYGLFVNGSRAMGKNHLEFLLNNSRGFIGQDLFEAIRLRPTVPLLMLLLHRLRTFNSERLEKRRMICEKASIRIQEMRHCRIPGTMADAHYFWLFPVLVDEPTRIAKKMLDRGFDATSSTTSLACVDDWVTERTLSYTTVFNSESAVSADVMRHVLYLPINADTPSAVMDRMLDALDECTTSAAEARL